MVTGPEAVTPAAQAGAAFVVLGEITAPVSPDVFLSDYWGRRAVYMRDPSRRFDRYFGWNALNAVLNSGDLTYPSTVVSREDRLVDVSEFTSGSDNRVVDPLAMMRLVRDGASFSVRSADALWPPLRALRTGLYDALFEVVHTNVYFSPASTQGFRCHYDLHEVFVLQIEGTKHWKVFAPTTEAPVEPWRQEDVPSADVAPYVDCMLGPGDVLYVPRGHWHYAVAQDRHSLHITVGVKTRKGDELLDWLARELRSSEVWRRNVPAMGRGAADGALPLTPVVQAWVDELRDMLIARLRDPELWERFIEDLFTRTSPVAVVRMPEDATATRRPIDQLTFRPPAGQRHLVRPGTNGTTVLKAAGMEMVLEGVDARVLARVLAASAVTLHDLEQWAPQMARQERVELLESLVDAGLLLAGPL
jgi:ribosomal protein L16 Arg81 hydroxylase